MHIRIRAKKYFLGLKKRVIGPWILISTLVFHMASQQGNLFVPLFATN
jgi:hypothetical protein